MRKARHQSGPLLPHAPIKTAATDWIILSGQASALVVVERYLGPGEKYEAGIIAGIETIEEVRDLIQWAVKHKSQIEKIRKGATA